MYLLYLYYIDHNYQTIRLFLNVNIAIEYQCYGKPSGINATEADYWFHNLCVGEDVYATLVFKTENLKKIIDSLERKVSVSGGDHNASRMYLVSLQKLFDVKTIKEYISL